MKPSKHLLALLLGLLLLTALMGCGKSGTAEPAGSVRQTEFAEQPEVTETPEETPAPERQNGEQFETTILVEGMEETVLYQHLRNESAGFAMDFECESFTRISETDRERFVSIYDDPENPENYLEVSYCPETADAVSAAISAALSENYMLSSDTVELDGAGACLRIDASATADGSHTADVLRTVYIIPADDGCRVATARYLPEGSDGFGKRLAYMVNTISVFDPVGQRRLSDEEARVAVRRYCIMDNPSLEQIMVEEPYPVYWVVESSEEAQIVVLFRSYTGALLRYYIDPVSGDSDVTADAGSATNGEQPLDEHPNLWNYVDWWRGAIQ